MADKVLNTRVQQKHDIEANWLKATNFIPKIGEVIVYDPDETHAAARVKIGDGERTVGQLPFISEQADWEVNDETSAAYVKNRPFHMIEPEGYIFKDVVFDQVTEVTSFVSPANYIVFSRTIVEENEYILTINGISQNVMFSPDGEGYSCYTSNGDFFVFLFPELGLFALDSFNEVVEVTISLHEIVDGVQVDILPSTTVTLQSAGWKVQRHTGLLKQPIENAAYEAYIDGVLYKDWWTYKYCNDVLRILNDNEDCIYTINIANDTVWLSYDSDEVKIPTISLYCYGSLCTKLDECYLPDKNFNILNGSAKGSLRTINSSKESDDYTLGKYSFTEGFETQASGSYAHAECYITQASGNRSHAEGWSTKAIGDGSHSEGRNTEASGYISHAEGYNTKASGDYSHAEGQDTEASGGLSHAEGAHTKASGGCSHAEGNNTEASYQSAHAEGEYTKASGWSSHAEGHTTEASESFSHAEGCNTKASSECQHVQGKYNIEDSTSTYGHIVGNGTTSKRSNAHTLDWQGNAWYSGDVYVGSTSGTNKDEGSKKLATEDFVNAAHTAITFERIDEICGIEPIMTLAVNEDGDAVINAGFPDDEGNLTI